METKQKEGGRIGMTPTTQHYFALLQAGLWGKEANSSLFGETTDWDSIYNLAKSQTTLGIVYDGMLTLPNELRPERPLFMKWSALVARIEEDNEFLNTRLKEVDTLYRTHGIIPILLKGQGVAQNYLCPRHRQSGDIDLYVSRKHYTTANALLRREATGEHEENNKHTNIRWRNVDIENHRIIAHLSVPRANRLFQRYVANWYPQGRLQDIDGHTVTLPPLEFDVVFILMHSVLHFLNEGVGLRQVCDWTCLLHANAGKLNHDLVNRLLRQFGLYKAAKAFGAIATAQLGLSADELPFALTSADHQLGAWLLDDILRGGNFGRSYDGLQQRPHGYWKGKLHTFFRAYRRCAELKALAPGEARWYPFMLFLASLKTQFRLRLSRLSHSR